MKRFALFFVVTVGFIASSRSATINVDNYRPGAQYSNLQTAINSASPGDTILIHPSPNSYGNISLDKNLYLKGPGHWVPYTTLRAIVGNINLQSGSDSSVIDGLYIRNANVSTPFYTKVHDLIIINNFFFRSGISGGKNGCCPSGSNFGETKRWLVEGNIFWSNSPNNLISLGSSGTPTDWLITNNAFYYTYAFNVNGIFYYLNGTSVVSHNTFLCNDQGGNVTMWGSSSGATIENNIFYGHDANNTNFSSGCSSCVFNHNLTYNSSAQVDSLPNGTGNLDNVDPQFVELTTANFSTNSNHVFKYVDDLHLQAGSPALTGGVAGAQIGLYGGGGYFHPYGWSAYFPQLLSIQAKQRIVPVGDSIQVDVKVQRGGF